MSSASANNRSHVPVASWRGRLRRLTQFSIRTMLLVTAVIAGVLGVWSHDARRQKAAVAWIRAHGGNVMYHHETHFVEWNLFGPSTRALRLVEPTGVRASLARHMDVDWVDSVAAVVLDGRRIQTDDMTYLASLRKLESLEVRWPSTGPGGLEFLESLTRLRFLSLDDSTVGDDDLVSLSRLSRLEELDLSGTRVTNEGLRHLAHLRNLRRLTLHSRKIGDEGLRHIADLPALEHLGIGNTEVTDAGMAHLKDMPRLKSIILWNNRIGERGLQHLMAAPELETVDVVGTDIRESGRRDRESPLPPVWIENPGIPD